MWGVNHLKHTIFGAGDEFYMREWPELVGRSFLEVLTMFPDAVPLGIRTPEGNLMINPEDSFVINAGGGCALQTWLLGRSQTGSE